MSLIKLWRAEPETVLAMSLPTLVTVARDPDPTLRDGSRGSAEFRQYLTETDPLRLAAYATFCLENPFTESGQVLQDIVNEIGRRLGFKVENGRYRGAKNAIGFDGIWTCGRESLVIEVKTTDAYAISLDVIAKYRDRLVDENRAPKSTPVLIVMGRNDTQSLEAQVRGSQHAWSMRIVGIDALIKLMEVSLATSSEEVTEKIHAILRPMEYTRIDSIVEIMFSTVEDKEQQLEEIPESNEGNLVPTRKPQQRTPRSAIEALKSLTLSRFASRESTTIHQRRHSLYANPSDLLRVVIVTSKRYDDNGYWYAYHDEPQRSFLSYAKHGFLILAMTDKDFAFAIPFAMIESVWNDLNQSVKRDGSVYKHIMTYEVDEKHLLRIRAVKKYIDLEPYRF